MVTDDEIKAFRDKLVITRENARETLDYNMAVGQLSDDEIDNDEWQIALYQEAINALNELLNPPPIRTPSTVDDIPF